MTAILFVYSYYRFQRYSTDAGDWFPAPIIMYIIFEIIFVFVCVELICGLAGVLSYVYNLINCRCFFFFFFFSTISLVRNALQVFITFGSHTAFLPIYSIHTHKIKNICVQCEKQWWNFKQNKPKGCLEESRNCISQSSINPNPEIGYPHIPKFEQLSLLYTVYTRNMVLVRCIFFILILMQGTAFVIKPLARYSISLKDASTLSSTMDKNEQTCNVNTFDYLYFVMQDRYFMVL